MYINILRTGIWLILVVIFIMEAMKTMERNVIKILSNQQLSQTEVSNTLIVQKNQPIRYSLGKLLQLREKVVHHNEYKIINSQACITIRKLRLNRRPVRRGKKILPRTPVKQNRVNVNNLKLIKIQATFGKIACSKRFSMTLCNVQSLKNKQDVLVELLEENKTDILVCTETWMKSGDEVWFQTSDLYRAGYRITEARRQGKRGGGIGLIHKLNVKANKISSGNNEAFEQAVWKLQTSNRTLHVCAIYRPPDTSERLFIDDFTEFMVDVIAEYSNLIVVGDFNMHINKEENPNASIFMDTMVALGLIALGLKQHTIGSTHRSGNCLDLVFTEELSRLKVINCVVGTFVSDHAAVEVIFDIRKDDLARKKVSYCKLKDIDIDKFAEDLNLSEVDDETIDVIVNHMERKMKSTLDKHAPIVTKDVTTRKTKPWFNSSIRTQKRKMRHSEKLFR